MFDSVQKDEVDGLLSPRFLSLNIPGFIIEADLRPATEVKAGHAIAEPTGEVIRAVNRGDVPTKLVILYVAPPRTPFLEEEEGREPAPCSQASFAALMQAWADSGAACPAR